MMVSNICDEKIITIQCMTCNYIRNVNESLWDDGKVFTCENCGRNQWRKEFIVTEKEEPNLKYDSEHQRLALLVQDRNEQIVKLREEIQYKDDDLTMAKDRIKEMMTRESLRAITKSVDIGYQEAIKLQKDRMEKEIRDLKQQLEERSSTMVKELERLQKQLSNSIGINELKEAFREMKEKSNNRWTDYQIIDFFIFKLQLLQKELGLDKDKEETKCQKK